MSLGITFRTTWRDARDAIERKAPAETDVLEDNDRRRLVDELVSKLGKVRPPLLYTTYPVSFFIFIPIFVATLFLHVCPGVFCVL